MLLLVQKTEKQKGPAATLLTKVEEPRKTYIMPEKVAGRNSMTDLKFDIDIDELAGSFGQIKKEVSQDLKKAVGSLAAMTHAKTIELANKELKSLSKTYKDNISFQQLEENLWVVSLDEKVLWIEEGRKGGFMEELLNGKSGKVNAKGERYAVIPFEHSKNPTEQSDKARELTNQIKAELKDRKIPYRNKIEHHADGSPKLGLLHKFNIESARLKDTHKDEPLKGVAIYQKMNEKTGKVQRDVMTFRVITEKHREEGKWIHPGRQGSKLMDKAFEWAMTEWEQKILPDILGKYE